MPEQFVSTVDIAQRFVRLPALTSWRTHTGSRSRVALRDNSQCRPSSAFIGLPKAIDISSEQELSEWRGVCTERYTYARRTDGTPWLLYDNETDPYQQETSSQAKQPSK